MSAMVELPPSVDAERAETLLTAVRASWSAATTADADRWTPDRPAIGHCDVSSLLFWDEFGGDLVLSAVFVGDEQTEHHWWNRIDGVDVDITREQFFGHEEIRELQVFEHDEVVRRRGEFRPEVLARAERFRRRVALHLEC